MKCGILFSWRAATDASGATAAIGKIATPALNQFSRFNVRIADARFSIWKPGFASASSAQAIPGTATNPST